jgi:multidrug efflux pump
MTSLATAIGALPLVLYEGAGAQSRLAIGIVVFAGVIFATLLTLYVVPVFYDLLARFTRSPGAIAAEIAAWERANPGVSAGDAHGTKAPAE